MAYPHILLTKPWRRSIMVFLIAVFCISAPLIILYTAGYRYDWVAGRVEQTGVISIDVQPRDVHVFLNAVLIKKAMPIRLANRAPGTYHLVLQKNGYRTWEKDITVSSKKTTYIKNVTLFEEALPVGFFPSQSASDIRTLYSSADGSTLMTVTGTDASFELSAIDTRTKKKTSIDRGGSDTTPVVSWSPWTGHAIIMTTKNKTLSIALFSTKSNAIIRTVSLPSATPANISYQWRQGDVDSVYLQQEREIIRVSEQGIEPRGELPTNASGWFVDSSGVLWIVRANDRTLTAALGNEETISLPDGVTRVVDMNDHRIIVQTATRMVVLPREGSATERYDIDAQHASYNAATGEWILFSPSELWTVYPDGHAVLLSRRSDKILNVVALDPYGVLLLQTENGVLAFNPGYYVTAELFSKGTIESIGVNQKLRRMYFLGEIGKQRDVFELRY